MATTSTLAYADMIALYPELTVATTAEQSVINRWIIVAENRIHRTTFGDDADDVVLTMAAHLYTMARRSREGGGQGTGSVTSRANAESSVAYSAAARGDGYDDYRTTPYGMIYLSILRGLNKTPFVASSS